MRHPRITWALCVILTRLIVRLRVQYRERLPLPDDGPCVVACRHISWIDPLVIVRVLGPRRPDHKRGRGVILILSSISTGPRAAAPP